MTWGVLLTCLAMLPAGDATGSGPAGASSATALALSLRLEQAIPVSSQGAGRTPQDLHLDLTVRGGKLEPTGWAWLAAMPGSEHRVKVMESDLAPDRLRVKLEVDFTHQTPLFVGGRATIALDLARQEDQLVGEFQCLVRGPTDEESRKLWWSLGGGAEPKWRAALGTGTTASVSRVPRRTLGSGGVEAQPVLARGQLRPAPVQAAPTGATEGARLLPCKPGELAAYAATAEGRRAVAAVQAWVKAGQTPNEDGDLPVVDDGLAAVAQALLSALGADGQAGKAVPRHALAALAAITPPPDPSAAPAPTDKAPDRSARWIRNLASVCLALELTDGGKAFEPEALRQLRAGLPAVAVRWAAIEPASPKAPVFGAGTVLGDPGGAYDCRLAAARAAAGMALLALPAGPPDAADAPTAGQRDAALAVCARSVRRFLQTGVGERGAGTGQYGFDLAMQVVVPFVRAYARATGVDLSAGTGAGQVTAWALTAGGPESLVVAGLPLASAQVRALARGCLAPSTPPPGDPWAALWLLVNQPLETAPAAPAERPGVLALSAADRSCGQYLWRSGWDGAGDFVTVMHHAASSDAGDQAAGQRGQFAIFGLGRWWVRPPAAPEGDPFGWPQVRQGNGMQVLDSLATTRKALVPAERGRLASIQMGRDGSGSVSMTAGGFREVGQTVINPESVEDAGAWTTLAADYSGRSGARALFATVTGTYGLGDRQRVWEIDLGEVPARNVVINGLAFAVTPPEARGASMTGAVVFPPTAHLEYQAPADGRGGRLRVFMVKPGPNIKELLEESMAAKAINLDRLGQPDYEQRDQKQVDIDVSFILNDKDPRQAEELQQAGRIVLNKLYRHTSSVKMGAPDRYPKARGSAVVVWTIQPGPAASAPAVKVLGKEQDGLVRVGKRIVNYREHLITFEDAQ